MREQLGLQQTLWEGSRYVTRWPGSGSPDPFGWRFRPFARRKPAVLRTRETIRAAGRGYVLPLLETQRTVVGIAFATSEDRIAVVSLGRIVLEADWSDVQSYEVGPFPIPHQDDPVEGIQLRTGNRTGRCLIAIRPQDEEAWLGAIQEYDVPEK